MAGNKCSYFQCGMSPRTCPGLRVFRFPSDEKRQKEWIVNSGNPDLLRLSPEDIRRKFICGSHFTERSFATNKKVKLAFNAVPNKFSLLTTDQNPLELQKPTTTYSRKISYPDFESQSMRPRSDLYNNPLKRVKNQKLIDNINDMPDRFDSCPKLQNGIIYNTEYLQIPHNATEAARAILSM